MRLYGIHQIFCQIRRELILGCSFPGLDSKEPLSEDYDESVRNFRYFVREFFLNGLMPDCRRKNFPGSFVSLFLKEAK